MSNILIPKMFGQQLRRDHWSTRGLVFYWRGIPAGNVVDESFSMNHGTFVGGITWSGDGLVFNGSDSYVTMSQTPKSDALTYIVRFKLNVIDTVHGLCLSLNGQSRFSDGRIIVDSFEKIRAQFVLGGTLRTIDGASSTFSADIWYTVAVVIQDGDQRIYVDGVVNGTPQTYTGTIDTGSDPFTIGRGYQVTGWIFDGVMSDIVYYNRVLSASEVMQLTLNLNLPMQQDPIWLFTPPVVGVNPKGPLGHPLYGPFAGPIVC